MQGLKTRVPDRLSAAIYLCLIMQVSNLDERQPAQHQAPSEADAPQPGAQAPQEQPFAANNIPDPQLLSSPRTRQAGNMD
ncbi:unnamed protein product [Pleuronectes platessa]|uniref:Uncharacterized protein n=1 Tax=Pleuronectes platessa TaxID=8262 RepID=A0A9N7VNX3_PLEPL|nr:unnamed protein product [Pleuronectes platessa]